MSDEETKTFGIGDTFTIEGPDGQPLTIRGNPRSGPNDMSASTPDAIQKELERVKEQRPRAETACIKCGRVHPPDKAPICVCANCGKTSRIVRPGQCVECAYRSISEYAASHGIMQEDVDNLPMFVQYVQWMKKEAERLAEEGLPWEKQ